MPSLGSTARQVLGNFHSIAVVGMSRTRGKPSHGVPAFMQSRGYKIIPVNPHAETIAGERCYASLDEVDTDVDIVLVFRPSRQATSVVEEAILRHKTRGDIGAIWLQEGITSQEGRRLAEAEGIPFVEDKCMHKEYFAYMG